MTGWRGSVIIVTTLAANLLLSGQSAAQSATVRGRLVDEQGQAIDGVHVTLRETGTGITRTDESDAEGLYRFKGLPAGVYDLRAARNGFATVVQKSTIVDVGSVYSAISRFGSRTSR